MNPKDKPDIYGEVLDRKAMQLPGWVSCPQCGSNHIDIITVAVEGEFLTDDAKQSYFECKKCEANSLYDGTQPVQWREE